jgi:hypothetical protein
MAMLFTGSYFTVPYSAGELTDAEQLSRQVAAELLSLGAGALGAEPSAARPGPRPNGKRVGT